MRRRFIAKTPRFARGGKTTERSLGHSPFYWWWRYLQADKSYGPATPVYKDFGDLGDNSPEGFRKWWKQHEQLFAEPPLAVAVQDVKDLEMLKTLDLNDYLVVVVGLDVAKRTTKRTFKRLLDKRHAGMKGGRVFERSKATYKFATKPVVSALETTLHVYEAAQRGGMTLWQIGEEADASPIHHIRRDDTKKAASDKKKLMAIIVRRYLNHANAYIANAGKGLFPKK